MLIDPLRSTSGLNLLASELIYCISAISKERGKNMAARSSGERVALMEFIDIAGEAPVETINLMC